MRDTVGRFRCVVRPDLIDYLNTKFEVQVKYPDGWRPLFEFGADDVNQGWEAAKRRYRSWKLRLMSNGKKIKENKP